MLKKCASRIYMVLIFAFLYLPIIVLIALSFNDSRSKVKWGGFTLRWYTGCFQDEKIMTAFVTTLQVTFLSAMISTLIGTLAALGIAAMKKRHQTIYLGATNIPLLNADIVTGISMMLLFVKFIDLGFVTVLLAHITFSIPYVILNVLPKMKQTNRSTYEAALDLGATPLYAFYKVTWPEIRPGVFSGFMMAVTMSLDDFSITYFTKGAGVNTLHHALHRTSQRNQTGIVCTFHDSVLCRSAHSSCRKCLSGEEACCSQINYPLEFYSSRKESYYEKKNFLCPLNFCSGSQRTHCLWGIFLCEKKRTDLNRFKLRKIYR